MTWFDLGLNKAHFQWKNITVHSSLSIPYPLLILSSYSLPHSFSSLSVTQVAGRHHVSDTLKAQNHYLSSLQAATCGHAQKEQSRAGQTWCGSSIPLCLVLCKQATKDSPAPKAFAIPKNKINQVLMTKFFLSISSQVPGTNTLCISATHSRISCPTCMKRS